MPLHGTNQTESAHRKKFSTSTILRLAVSASPLYSNYNSSTLLHLVSDHDHPYAIFLCGRLKGYHCWWRTMSWCSTSAAITLFIQQQFQNNQWLTGLVLLKSCITICWRWLGPQWRWWRDGIDAFYILRHVDVPGNDQMTEINFPSRPPKRRSRYNSTSSAHFTTDFFRWWQRHQHWSLQCEKHKY